MFEFTIRLKPVNLKAYYFDGDNGRELEKIFKERHNTIVRAEINAYTNKEQLHILGAGKYIPPGLYVCFYPDNRLVTLTRTCVSRDYEIDREGS